MVQVGDGHMEDFTPEELQAIYNDIEEMTENPDAFVDSVYELEKLQDVFDE